MNQGDIVLFDRKKYFTYIKPLGNPGGTGETRLFEDVTTNMLFAFKKYVPQDLRYVDENYRRFVDEIKILFRISHDNIVRIYNYYLFPKEKTGYLQMEYIDGKSIYEFTPDEWGKDWNDIFRETITAFEYLENNKILHRDIRPANILIDKDNNVKIIDFGFGKQLDCTNEGDNSVLLNWPATEMPDEVQLNNDYTHATEIYFVGTLFRHLVQDTGDDFKFPHIIEKMTKTNSSQRFSSFTEVSQAISEGLLGEIDFSSREKSIYRQFADDLSGHINYYMERYSPISNISHTLASLEDIIRNSALEEFVQNNSQLVGCFVNSGYNYKSQRDIKFQSVLDFYELITSLSPPKQKVLFDNLYNRLSAIKVKSDDDDLPF